MNVPLSAVTFTALPGGFHQLCIDLPESQVNIFNQKVLQDLERALDQLEKTPNLKGIVLCSAKADFALGADISAFGQLFTQSSSQQLSVLLARTQTLFNRLEDLALPTVCAINGQALGGGFEVALATDYRVISEQGSIALPEVKLGIFPGWGGTVRLPRLIGIDNANEWICGAVVINAQSALRCGAVDAVVKQSELLDAAITILEQCSSGALDYLAKREEKKTPVLLSQLEQMMAFESAKALVAAKTKGHYPAPLAALKSMQKSVSQHREKAQLLESEHFIQEAKGPVCRALVKVFEKDQALKKRTAEQLKAGSSSHGIAEIAVIGAGIMGAGIAAQSLVKGVPTRLKDVTKAALIQGQSQVANIIAARVKRGKLAQGKASKALLSLTSQLDYQGFSDTELVVEAATENVTLKCQLLAEVERQLDPKAILTSNTSTLSIDTLAAGLVRPENFCGLHFFNPVERMPLVEVIRGKHSSEAAVQQALAFAVQLGKKPIVVKDCPGFLVNRVLFPYFFAFNQLLQQGVDFRHIDQLMQQFGWPMGPAQLLDVVGIDTACHAAEVMTQGFPKRMTQQGESALQILNKAQYLGEKSHRGFYCYQQDKKGSNQRVDNPDIDTLLAPLVQDSGAVEDKQIIWRMMIPMLIEAVRCLEEEIVEDGGQLDLALIYGIGFPPFLGGALGYLNEIGLAEFVKLSDELSHLGALYQVTEQMREMAKSEECFCSTGGSV